MATMESKRGFQSFGMGSSQPTKTQPHTSTKPVSSVWNTTTWGNNSAIGIGRRNVKESTRTLNELADSSPISEAVTGPGSLLHTSDLDNHILRQTPWNTNPDDLSPGLSVENTSPLMRQKSNHSGTNTFKDMDSGDAPYFSLTPASGNISSRSSQKNFLDPAAGNFAAAGVNGSISGQSRSSRHNSDESDSFGVRQSLFNTKDYGLTMHSGRVNNNVSGYTSSAASRSGSQPPSRSEMDYSSRQRGDPHNVQYSRPGASHPASSSHRPNTSTVSNASSFVMHTGNSVSDYNKTWSSGQLDHLAHCLEQMNKIGDGSQLSYTVPRIPTDPQSLLANGAYGLDGQNEPWRNETHVFQPRQDQFSPTGSSAGSFGSTTNQFRAPAFPQQYTHSQNSSDTRVSQSSSFYPNSDTPPAIYQQRTPSRGYYNNIQSSQAAALERKLRGLQQQQQALGMPQPSQLQFRNQLPHPFDLQSQNGLQLSSLQSYYQMPPAPPHMLSGPSIPRGPARDHDMGQQVRSPLLEEFRNNSKTNKRYELKDIYNHIVEFSGDQHGSRFIQQKLETANSDEKDQVFRELHANSLQLMTDVFGNYVIQKFFEHGNQAQKKMLANQMRNHVLALSMQIYGCRVVQKALEHILTDQQAQLISELKEKVMICVKDQNGNHVVQKAIERVPAQHIQFIISAFTGRVQESATHPYGCRVIQRMLEYCEEPTRTAVLRELHACTPSLIVDQYGNYVTQHVIEHGKPEDRARIIQLVTANLVIYSKHKFASNVVEKSIQFGSTEERRALVSALRVVNDKGENPVQGMIRDQYGNYVMQKLITQLRGPEWSDCIELIKEQISLLKRFSFGNGKQIAAVEKVLCTEPLSSSQSSTDNAFPAIDTSAAVTPALTTGDAQSPQSSEAPSTHAGSIDVAAASRKSSGSNNNIGILTPASTQSKDHL